MSSGLFPRLAQGGFIALLLAAVALGGYCTLLSHRLALSQQQLAVQKERVTQQAGVIATLQTQERQNRELMAAQQRQEQQLRQQRDNDQRKYREAIKNDVCAEQSLPGTVFELLRPAFAASTYHTAP